VVGKSWHERWLVAVATALRQGTTPEGIALSLACGTAVGLFPVLGTTTLLGLALAPALRLNLALVQAANWAVYPLQLMLVLPLVRLGDWLAGSAAFVLAVPPAAAVPGEAVSSLARVGVSVFHGVLGWVTVVPVVVTVVYGVSMPLLRALAARIRPSGSAHPFASSANGTPR
jgi:uncharacterized protein (DUF2062 family)